MSKMYGITREAEEQKLQETIAIADQKLQEVRQSAKNLADELHEMLEIFDESDKEAMTLWNNTNSMFREVSQSIRRAERARKKPYFGRIDFRDKKIGVDEVYYIGRSAISKNPSEPDVIDWRAPIASVYYDSGLGETSYTVQGEGDKGNREYQITLSRKRTYEIEDDRLKAFYDSDVVANDELLTKYLAKNKNAVLGNIIATIQQEQNEVIRKKPQHNVLVQGAAGSGKTTVAMHRISYILYNYEMEFPPEDFYIIGSNQMLLNYITGVLPELDVYGVSQMTMEQLFIRLLYEDWDRSYTVKPVQRGVTPAVKGTQGWFDSLREFCDRYERSVIPQGDVTIEKNGVVLLSKEDIARIMQNSSELSRADKIARLTEHLTAKLENEISGKYYSYSPEEKKALERMMKTYFGKREWKGSIFDLYDEFLAEQREKGNDVESPGTSFDVYDLAALAYLYKRIKEEEMIREAGHVIIDEAQDFGMMVYCSLKHCLSKCTYTIMGDVSQNISLEYGLNDWTELRELMLPDEWDYFGLLRKSYRNTVEISHFATNILYHGSFQTYPVEPIIRHGEEVRTIGCDSTEELLKHTEEEIRRWLESGRETVAVICADQAEADMVFTGLQGKVPLIPMDRDHMEFKNGVMVLSLENTKGLEFDAVLLFNASEDNYPAEDGHAKRLYVAATRALHELTVLYQGNLTKLISDPVPEDRVHSAVAQPAGGLKKSAIKVVREMEGERKTRKDAREKTKKEILFAKLPENESGMPQKSLQGSGQQGTAVQESSGSRETAVQEGSGSRETAAKKAFSSRGTAVQKNMAEESLNTVRSHGIASVSSFRSSGQESVNLFRRSGAEVLHSARSQGSVRQPVFQSEFGSVPDSRLLTPVGRSRIDCSVRFVVKGKGYVDFGSNYGTLRITPLADDVIRICFAKGQCSQFPERLPEYASGGFRCKMRESQSAVEFVTEKVIVHVDKKTGVVSFADSKGKLLLSERQKDPRQVADERAWMFFDWAKAESLSAKDWGDREAMKIGPSFAKYISFGRESSRSPGIVSSNGYELLFAPGVKLLCCRIPVYGQYLSVEGTGVIDYYFKVR